MAVSSIPPTSFDGCARCALIHEARVRRASNWLGGDHDTYVVAIVELDLIGGHR